MDVDASEYIDPIIEYGPKVLGVLKEWGRGVRSALEKVRRNDPFFAKLGRYLILIGAWMPGCVRDQIYSPASSERSTRQEA